MSLASPLPAILVPVDGSECSNRALEIAATLIRLKRGKLEILHVTPVPPAYEKGVPIYSETASQVAMERDELRALAVPEGVTYEKHHRLGAPAQEILEFAVAKSVELIVMGTHGRKGLGRLLYGSVAEKVVRHAACPVLTYRAARSDTDTSSE